MDSSGHLFLNTFAQFETHLGHKGIDFDEKKCYTAIKLDDELLAILAFLLLVDRKYPTLYLRLLVIGISPSISFSPADDKRSLAPLCHDGYKQ
jgi:hypothetical protein